MKKYFTIEMLKKWKEDAEREAGNELIGRTIIKNCKYRMRIFYNDLIECQNAIELITMQSGISISSTLLPVQNNWEKNLEEVSESVGGETIATLYRIVREIEEFKGVMEEQMKKTRGKAVADLSSVRYCKRQDIFVERMKRDLTEDFLNIVKFYTELI